MRSFTNKLLHFTRTYQYVNRLRRYAPSSGCFGCLILVAFIFILIKFQLNSFTRLLIISKLFLEPNWIPNEYTEFKCVWTDDVRRNTRMTVIAYAELLIKGHNLWWTGTLPLTQTLWSLILRVLGSHLYHSKHKRTHAHTCTEQW